MKERKDDLLLSVKESASDGIVTEKPKNKGDVEEDMMVDVVGADVVVVNDARCKVDLNGVETSARDQVMEEASDDLVESKVVVAVSVSCDEQKGGNGPVMEDSRMDLERLSEETEAGGEEIGVGDNKEVTEEIVERAIESVKEVTGRDNVMDGKSGKETEVLSSSKITEPLSTTANHGSPEGHVVVEDKGQDGVKNQSLSTDVVKEGIEEDNAHVSIENMEPQVGVDQTSKESLQSTIELTTNDSKMAVESLFTEPHAVEGETTTRDKESEKGLTEEIVERSTESVQEVADLDLVMKEKTGKDEVLDSKKILVVEEGMVGKYETQDGVPEDQHSPCLDNYSLSNDAIKAGKDEGGDVHENPANLDQKTKVVENSKEESSQSTIEVKTDKKLNQKAEVDEISKDETSQSTIEVKTDDALKSGEGTGVGDSKMDDESRSRGDPEISEGEVTVIDKEEEPETKEIVEQPTGSVQEASDGDHVMDEKTGKKNEVLNSSKLPESSTMASLESEEVDVVVVEEKGLEGKDEAQNGISVEPTMVVNAGTGEDAVQVTESSDQKAEVDTIINDESSLATMEVDEVATAQKETNSDVKASTPVVACTEPESAIDTKETDTETSKVEPLASSDTSNIQEDQESIIANVCNDQSLVNSGNETTAPDIRDPTTGGPQAYAEHGVLPADSEFSYEEGHMERGEDAGMDIDEVLGWKDEIPPMQEHDEKLNPAILSLESEQWNETSVSLQQSGYFQPPENEGEFSVSDLVWGKVRSHPWWPGQIFDPSDASEDAMKYHKKDCFLVAYFGDRTFAWNESTVLKPFRSQFSQIEKHENSEALSNAIHSALEEVSRRVELGLTCSCTPQNIYENIKYQIVENSGISLESSKRRGIDKSASVSSFEPHKLVDYVRLLAKFPYGESDKMELTLAKAQLSSYGRFKGYRQLVEFQLCGDLLEEDETYTEDGSKKRKALDSISDGLEKRPTLHTPSFKVGACIQRVASQLTGPPLADHVAGSDVSMQSSGPIRLGNQAYEGKLLSQLHLVAQDPMKGYSFLNTIIPFFYTHRSVVLSKSRQLANDARKRKALNENDPEEFEFDDVNDSYWTDRIIQNYPDQNMLQENQNGGVEQHQHQHQHQHQVVAYEQQHQQQPVKQTRRSNKKRFFSSNHEIEAKEQSVLIERRRQNLAAEVLMKYTEGIYFPSEIHLNKMFKRFGPLMESETEVDRQSGRARVVFKKCSDAEVAHSSARKFDIFGSIIVNYELNYTPLISYKPLPLPFGQDPAC